MQFSAAADLRRPFGRPLIVRDVMVERRNAGRDARAILQRVSLVVPPGAIVAVTGPSGAGKTTLLHVMAGLAVPGTGTVLWGDEAITSLSESERDRWRRDTTGLVFQDFQLIGELGVLENILLPLRFDHWRAPQALVERAMKLAARVGLDPHVRRAGVLSRGEQQRLAIARALVRGPKLILADEPTASLDAENGARVTELLLDFARDAQASVVLVSHDSDLLSRADQVHRLVAGALQQTTEAAP
jgi:putative ABC transport system ATP-binding protein